MKKHQDIVPLQFASSDAIIRKLGEKYKREWDKDKRKLVSVSYRWLTALHPDPEGHHQVAVKTYLRKKWEAQDSDSDEGEKDTMEVFWDYICMPQMPRILGSEEDQRFRKSLSVMNVIYGHPGIAVLLQKHLPNEFPGVYNDSGWCSFESSVSLICKCETSHYCLPPRTPMRFDELIDTKKFTNGADSDTVKTLYHATFDTMATTARELAFTNIEWRAI